MWLKRLDEAATALIEMCLEILPLRLHLLVKLEFGVGFLTLSLFRNFSVDLPYKGL